ncbi:MAG: hypothetical protein RLY47_63 [Candidatus Parcubacteria bacterium]|jgi:hypothetical protein
MSWMTLLKVADVAGDFGGLEKLREMIFPGSKKDSPKEDVDVKSRPGQEHIVEGAIIEVAAPYILTPTTKREEFLETNKAAHDRVAIVFYRRNPKLRDLYEKFITQLPWWALSDGLGGRTKQAPPAPAPQAQQQQQKQQKSGGNPPDKSAQPAGTLDSEHVRLMMAFKICLGMQALAADADASMKGRKNPESAGDKIIRETIERMRSASPFDKGKKALEKGGKNVGDFTEGFFDEI